jgi:hypothetical protein
MSLDRKEEKVPDCRNIRHISYHIFHMHQQLAFIKSQSIIASLLSITKLHNKVVQHGVRRNPLARSKQEDVW